VSVTDETRKRLWGKSGNRCAVCRQELIRRDAGKEPGALVGQEAHIIARSPGGPRYMPLNPTIRDDYHNLILLCANDHREIDTQPGRYTVAHLRKLKREHEAWVAARLAHPQPGESNQALARVMQSGGQVWEVLQDCLGYECASPENLQDEDAEVVDDALQLFVDWGEIGEDVALQGLRKVREAKRSLQAALDALARAGFLVLGGNYIGPLANGQINGRIASLHVVRPEDLEALRADRPEGLR
jgi:hypothetical protein